MGKMKPVGPVCPWWPGHTGPMQGSTASDRAAIRRKYPHVSADLELDTSGRKGRLERRVKRALSIGPLRDVVSATEYGGNVTVVLECGHARVYAHPFKGHQRRCQTCKDPLAIELEARFKE